LGDLNKIIWRPIFVKTVEITRRTIKTSPNVTLDDVIRDLNRLSEGIDENNQNSVRRKLGRLGRSGRSLLGRTPYGLVLPLLDLLVPPQEEGWDTTGTQWSEYASCDTPNPAYNLGWSAAGRSSQSNNATIEGFTDGCLAGQAVPAAGLFNPFNPSYVTSSFRSVGIGKTIAVSESSYRVQYQKAFTRPSTGDPTPYPEYIAPVMALALPSVRPEMWSITAAPDDYPPFAAPELTPPIPWRLAPQRARLAQEDERLPVMQPSRQYNLWSIALSTPSEDGNNNFKPPRYHDAVAPSERPNRPDKERKLKARPIVQGALKVIGTVTEGADLVDAIYDALPERFRPRWKNTNHVKRKLTYKEKLQALYDHWDQVDLPEAVKNIVVNQIEDYFYGKVGKIGGEISRAHGHHYGGGVNSVMKRMFNVQRNVDMREEK